MRDRTRHIQASAAFLAVAVAAGVVSMQTAREQTRQPDPSAVLTSAEPTPDASAEPPPAPQAPVSLPPGWPPTSGVPFGDHAATPGLTPPGGAEGGSEVVAEEDPTATDGSGSFSAGPMVPTTAPGTPTGTDSADPSAMPTPEPTPEPTDEPSTTPSGTPSPTPTDEPSATPSEDPSATPSEDPSINTDGPGASPSPDGADPSPVPEDAGDGPTAQATPDDTATPEDDGAGFAEDLGLDVTAEDPGTEDPVTEDPVTEDPVTEDPVTEDPDAG